MDSNSASPTDAGGEFQSPVLTQNGSNVEVPVSALDAWLSYLSCALEQLDDTLSSEATINETYGILVGLRSWIADAKASGSPLSPQTVNTPQPSDGEAKGAE